MHAIRKTLVAAAAAVSALSMLGGAALADGGQAQAAEEGINLVQNGNFLGGTGHWTPGEDTVLVLKSSTGEVINTAPRIFQTTAMATQCVPFELGASPKFFGTIMVPEGQVRTGSAHFRLTFFEDSDCTDFNGSVALNSVTETGQTQQFQYQPDAWMAGDARSVLIQLVVVKNQSLLKHRDDPFAARFDSVALVVPSPAQDPAPQPGGPLACVVGTDGCDGEDEDENPQIVCPVVSGCDDDETPHDDQPVIEPPVIEPPAGPATDDGAKQPAPGDDAPAAPGNDAPAAPGAASDDDAADTPTGEPGEPGGNGDGDSTGSGQPGTSTGGNGQDGSGTTGGPTTGDKPGTTSSPNQGGTAGGPSAKPATNTGSPEQTPLAPATGSDAAAESSSGGATPLVFGAAGGAMALASLVFAIMLRRRKDSRD